MRTKTYNTGSLSLNLSHKDKDISESVFFTNDSDHKTARLIFMEYCSKNIVVVCQQNYCEQCLKKCSPQEYQQVSGIFLTDRIENLKK